MKGEDVQLGEVQVRKPRSFPVPTEDPGVTVLPKGDARPGETPLFVRESALADITSFSCSAPDREVGGMLVGRYGCWQGRDFVVVDHFLRALHAVSRPASLRFTHDTFEAAWREIGRLDPAGDEGHLLVGWHHTHPGLGLFLSGHDRFIQEHFFNLPWQVALVVDPRRGALKFFRWAGGELADTGSLLVQGA